MLQFACTYIELKKKTIDDTIQKCIHLITYKNSSICEPNLYRATFRSDALYETRARYTRVFYHSLKPWYCICDAGAKSVCAATTSSPSDTIKAPPTHIRQYTEHMALYRRTCRQIDNRASTTCEGLTNSEQIIIVISSHLPSCLIHRQMVAIFFLRNSLSPFAPASCQSMSFSFSGNRLSRCQPLPQQWTLYLYKIWIKRSRRLALLCVCIIRNILSLRYVVIMWQIIRGKKKYRKHPDSLTHSNEQYQPHINKQ